MPAHRATRILPLVLTALLAACQSAAPTPSTARVYPYALEEGAQVGRVEVFADAELSKGAVARLEAEGTFATIRQSALDWLDNGDHWSPEGELVVQVRIRVLRLRSAANARVLESWGGTDRLLASVAVRRGGDLLKTFAVGVESQLGGPEWAGGGDRLDRMARILGVRIADGL